MDKYSGGYSHNKMYENIISEVSAYEFYPTIFISKGDEYNGTERVSEEMQEVPAEYRKISAGRSTGNRI